MPRALAAQAFPLTATTRHQFTQSTVSATKLVADTDVAVRVALARNDDVRRLPEDEAGLREVEGRDSLFPDIDLAWWSG